MKRLKHLCILLTFCWLSAQSQQVVHHKPNRPVEVNNIEKEYVTGLFRSDNAYTFIVEDDPAASARPNVFNYLQGRIPGLLIYEAAVPYHKPVVTYRSARPALFLDEMPVDAGLLLTIDMSDIALIKVFRPPFIGAFGGGSGGAIAVYTKKGGDDDEE